MERFCINCKYYHTSVEIDPCNKCLEETRLGNYNSCFESRCSMNDKFIISEKENTMERTCVNCKYTYYSSEQYPCCECYNCSKFESTKITNYGDVKAHEVQTMLDEVQEYIDNCSVEQLSKLFMYLFGAKE